MRFPNLTKSKALYEKLHLRNSILRHYFARMATDITPKAKIPGLRELFDQIERWYAEATNSGLQQSLEVKLFAADCVVNQINVTPSTTYRGKVVNNRDD